MAAYYNEIDPYAAQWLRNLIAAGHIAPGDVDERSIKDVRAQDLKGYTQCHFFAGIGVWSYALRLAGWPDDRPVWTGSCPCQPFSAAGKRLGTDDERHLWPVWSALIRECRPVAVFGEQVASKDGLAWLDTVLADLENSGYAAGAIDLCAAGVGAPHIRQRLFFVADAEHAQRRSHGVVGNPHHQGPQGRGLSGATGGAAGTADGSVGYTEGRARNKQPCEGEQSQIAFGRPSVSFWSTCDWLPCIDGKARPVEPIAQSMADGSSESLGRLRPDTISKITQEILNVYPSEAIAREALFNLRKALSAKALDEWDSGRLHSVRQAPILLAFMFQLAEQGWPLTQGIPRSRKKATKEMLRSVRREGQTSCASCGRGLDEQQPGECSNSLHLVSSLLACAAQEAWGKTFDRHASDAFPLIRSAISQVGRLRAYGNAIVAEAAAEFIRASADESLMREILS